MPRYYSEAFLFLRHKMITTEELYKLFQDSTGVQTDTRQLKEGELFIALKGDNFNGNLYATKALENGARFAIVDEEEYVTNENCYLVEDGLTALQDLSKHHRLQFDIPFLAITGSNGKTTTKELVATVLSKKFNVLATKGNFNNHIGVPLTLLSLKKEHDFAIIEMGANHIGEIASYCKWALPTHALINNCGKAHLEGFGGIEGVRKGKGELYDFIREAGGTIFRNADYDYLKTMAAGINKEITYGEFGGDIKAKIYEIEPFLKVATLNSNMEQIIDTNLVGDYNLPNILAAITIGDYYNIPFQDITNAISAYVPNNNRSEHRVVKDINIVLDAYNANPMSMKAAIKSFSNTSHKNKTIMLGAMMELGAESELEHKGVLDFASQFSWRHVVTVGQEFEASSQAMKIQNFKNATEAKEWFWDTMTPEDWVYIKGSRLTAMEKIVE